MRTAFVTGGTGFLGANLIQQLTQGGWQVTAMHRETSDLSLIERFSPRLVQASLFDAESLSAAIPQGVDAVFHVAGDVNFWKLADERQTRTNVLGTRAICEAALARGARRFVQTSTVSVWGLRDGRFDESAETTAETCWVNYHRSKWLAEQEVYAAIERGLDAVMLNPCNIVGPFDRSSWGKLFLLIRDGKLPGLGPGSASWCHVRDVAAAHVAAVEQGRTGERYLLGGPHASFQEVGALIAELVGGKPPRTLPAWLLGAVGQVNEWVGLITKKEPDVTPEAVALVCASWSVDSSKAKEELGYSESALREMFEDSHAWLVEEGLL